LTIGGVSQHLISYYKIEDVEEGRLRSPSSLPELASLDISPEYLDKTHFRNPPKVEIGVDGLPRYRGEADDVDSSPPMLPAPLSSGLPLLNDAHGGVSPKRAKRFDPYGGTPKRSRKGKGSSPQTSSAVQPTQSPSPAQPHPHGYHDSNLAVIHHPHYSPYGVPSYYQVPGYPLPPPHPHMYTANPYPGAALAPNGTLPLPAQQGAAPTQTPQFPYHGYPSTANSLDSPQNGPSGQQAYYPYYPPHGHYPGYGGVAWPHYTGYPPQPTLQQSTLPTSATMTEVEGKIQTNSEGRNLDDGADNEDV
jgi:hypothetical protein